VGNAYDKYASRNPVAVALTRRFIAALEELLAGAAPSTLLDVGCGEGVLAQRWARRWPDLRVVAVDREALAAEWELRAEPNLSFAIADACALPFPDRAFDVVSGVELLEQVSGPSLELAMAELARVARRAVLLSVPREPLWRVLNVLRGAYVGWLGNPPGHVSHFSRRAFVRLAGGHGRVAAVRSPLPWTIVLLELA
jgi:ubiquinone/menaquinone biosynthesis C-methylase UbiE